MSANRERTSRNAHRLLAWLACEGQPTVTDIPSKSLPDNPQVGQVLPRSRIDPEAAALLHDLSRMQTWATMLMARSNPTPGAREAFDLIQRTRAFVVERCLADG